MQRSAVFHRFIAKPMHLFNRDDPSLHTAQDSTPALGSQIERQISF